MHVKERYEKVTPASMAQDAGQRIMFYAAPIQLYPCVILPYVETTMLRDYEYTFHRQTFVENEFAW